MLPQGLTPPPTPQQGPTSPLTLRQEPAPAAEAPAGWDIPAEPAHGEGFGPEPEPEPDAELEALPLVYEVTLEQLMKLVG